MAKANPFPRRGLVGLLALGLSAAASAPARAQIDPYICQENNQYGIAQGFKPGDK